MRRIRLRTAALACAAAGALFIACKSPDGADTTASQRRATNATNPAGTTTERGPAGAAPTPYTNRPAAPQVDAHGHTDTARRVSIGELQQMLAKGEAVAVDVRSPEAYRQGRIKGAILLPSDEVRARAKELPKDKLLVFYCA